MNNHGPDERQIEPITMSHSFDMPFNYILQAFLPQVLHLKLHTNPAYHFLRVVVVSQRETAGDTETKYW